MVFQILAKIEMTWNKNWLFGHRFETVQHFYFIFSRIMIFYSAYIYMVQISLQNSGGKVIFLGTPPPPPWALTGSESTLVTWVLSTYFDLKIYHFTERN